MININKEKKTIKQFVKLCRIALKYEKVNYYSERKRMAERESHIEMFSEKQLEMIDKVLILTMPIISRSWDMKSAL